MLPGLFTESHWSPEFGVTSPRCLEAQLDRVASVIADLPRAAPLFVFLNVAALHQPNRHYLPGATSDSIASHAAALEYVDRHLGRLFGLVTSSGTRLRHHRLLRSRDGVRRGRAGRAPVRPPVIWTVPYAEFTLRAGDWPGGDPEE